ncbi:hypothetical protein [uncultured Microbacterium sp.]|uniref:hypothetical protein n=1 Tax=uncultured Microbacterium sp. TaxID=191216 RepID=UPI00260B3377|nr:hypothetical protein [uncultured Microbacterium sp.]
MSTFIAPGQYAADHKDSFLVDGTATLGDLPGAEPSVGDRILVRRPRIVRGRVASSAARAYVVEGVETRETQVRENGVHLTRDMTNVRIRLVPGGN